MVGKVEMDTVFVVRKVEMDTVFVVGKVEYQKYGINVGKFKTE